MLRKLLTKLLTNFRIRPARYRPLSELLSTWCQDHEAAMLYVGSNGEVCINTGGMHCHQTDCSAVGDHHDIVVISKSRGDILQHWLIARQNILVVLPTWTPGFNI